MINLIQLEADSGQWQSSASTVSAYRGFATGLPMHCAFRYRFHHCLCLRLLEPLLVVEVTWLLIIMTLHPTVLELPLSLPSFGLLVTFHSFLSPLPFTITEHPKATGSSAERAFIPPSYNLANQGDPPRSLLGRAGVLTRRCVG